MFRRAVLLVHVFYAVTAYRLYGESRSLTHLTGPVEQFDFLWPVQWMALIEIETAGRLLAHFGLLSAALGIVFWRFLIVRVLVSAALLQYMALENSYGSMAHGYHEWFWISVCFWFLPNGRATELEDDRLGRTAFLFGFGVAQAMILFFYSLSGAYKCITASLALARGEFGGFSPYAMANTLADRALETGSSPMWIDLIMTWPLLGWPLYLGLYFIELFAIAILFRPVLHKAWGLVLIAFHFGTLLFMDIVFPLHVLVNAMLFVLSPFAPVELNWRAMLAAIPVLGWFFRRAFGWRASSQTINIQAVRG